MKKSFYQKLRCGEPVRILINGDSISEFSGPGEWPTLLCEALCARYGSSVNFDNVSMGGNASYAGWARALYQKDVRYDLMINGYGQNDAEDGFSEAYESIIRAAAKTWPDCCQLSILESAQKGYSKKIKDIQALAAHYGIPTADTIAPFLPVYDTLTDDGCHPNAKGKRIYASVIADLISSLAVAETGLPSYEKEPLNPGVKALESMTFIPARLCARDGNAFTAAVEAGGRLGIDYYFRTGENSLGVTLGGREIARRDFTWTYNFSQRHILSLGADAAPGEIRVEFGDKQQADGFFGLIVSREAD